MESNGNGDNKKLKCFVLEFSDGNSRIRQQRSFHALSLSHAKDILWYEIPDAVNIMDVTEEVNPDETNQRRNFLDDEVKFGGSASED